MTKAYMFDGLSFDSMHEGENLAPQNVAAGGVFEQVNGGAADGFPRLIWTGTAWMPLDAIPTTAAPVGRQEGVKSGVFPVALQIESGPAKFGRVIAVCIVAVANPTAEAHTLSMTIGGLPTEKFTSYQTSEDNNLLAMGVVQSDTLGGVLEVEVISTNPGVDIPGLWNAVVYELHAPGKAIAQVGLNFAEGIQPTLTGNVSVIENRDLVQIVMSANEDQAATNTGGVIDPPVIAGKSFAPGPSDALWAYNQMGLWVVSDPPGTVPFSADYGALSPTASTGAVTFYFSVE